MKAFIFTLDVIVALLIFTLLLTLVITYFSQPDIPRSIYLKQLSTDFLLVAGQRDVFRTALDGDPLPLRNLFRHVPSSICMQARLIDSFDNETVVSDPSCTGYGRELQTSWASLYYNHSTQRVLLESWYRR